jgi:hypothetical protein
MIDDSNEKLYQQLKHYPPIEDKPLHDSLSSVLDYLNSLKMKQSYRYLGLTDGFCLDIYPNSRWYRFYFDRHNYIKYVPDILKILDTFSVGYSLDVSSSFNTYALFVTNGNYKDIVSFDRVSNTKDPLYEKSLFDLFNIRFESNHVLTSYSRTSNGFTCNFYTKKQCMEFEKKCVELIPEHTLNWRTTVCDILDKKIYCCDIIMKDEIEDKQYVTLSEMFGSIPKKLRKKKVKSTGLLSMLESYTPSEEQRELYMKMLEMVKNE